MKFRLGKETPYLPDPDLVELFEKGPIESIQALLDAHPDGLILSDPKGSVCAVNSAACALIRTTRKEVIGRPLSSLIRQDEGITTELNDALRSGRKFNTPWVSPEGYRVLVNSRPIGNPEHEPSGSLIVLRDLATINYLARSSTQNSPTGTFRIPQRREGQKDITEQRRLSPRLDEIIRRGERALKRGAKILLTGETGSGKTEIARTLYGLSFHESRPFVHVNCGGIPESLFESEMFGYEKGTFTGALQKGKAGHIESANNGILFLDEVGEMPLAVQSKLLTFLEEGRVQRVGSSKAIAINVRLISATNQSLPRMVNEGRFRKDLYYRLAVIALEVPPLHAQPELLPWLINNALEKINVTRVPKLKLSEALYAWMLSYEYPGNIRELANLMEVLSVIADDIAEIEHLGESSVSGGGRDVAGLGVGNNPLEMFQGVEDGLNLARTGGSLRDAVLAFEEGVIYEAIKVHGSKRKAARALGVNVSTIIRKITRIRESHERDGSEVS